MLGKKKEGSGFLPDLPESTQRFGGVEPRLHPVDEEEYADNERHTLPSFPDSPSHNKFSEAVIKDAVNNEISEENEEEEQDASEIDEEEVEEAEEGNDEVEEVAKPASKSNIKIVEMDKWDTKEDGVEESKFKIKSGAQKFSSSQRTKREFVSPKVLKSTKDVFVKIDKFHSAKRALEDVYIKLEEIDAIIGKIREVKLREEQELGVWERDLAQIKSRIEDVNHNIFEKVD